MHITSLGKEMLISHGVKINKMYEKEGKKIPEIFFDSGIN